MSPVIGFDIDGVLADFTRAFANMAQEMYGVRARSSGAQLEWRFPLTADQEQAIWDRIDSSNGRFWRELKLLASEGELDDMWDLSREGYQFTYVTSRHSKAKQATQQWLYEHQFPVGGVHFMKEKASYLSEVEDLVGFLDDSPEQIRAMRQVGVHVWVRDWPYNREPFGELVPRVGSVGEYLALVTGAILPAGVGGSLLWHTAGTAAATVPEAKPQLELAGSSSPS